MARGAMLDVGRRWIKRKSSSAIPEYYDDEECTRISFHWLLLSMNAEIVSAMASEST
jgi:hypothetical protein